MVNPAMKRVVLQKSDDIGQQLEEMLTRWGDWCRVGAEGAEGYPRDTIIGKFQRDGIPIGTVRGRGTIPEPNDPQVEQVELAMKALRRFNFEWADVVILSYVWGQPHAMVARQINCSYSVARDRLERGRAFIAGVMGREIIRHD